jgi:hypothetical protein
MSDLTGTLEGWRKLAYQMQPSAGAYSGNFKPGSKDSAHDAQWLRKISLIVYGSGSGVAGGSSSSGSSAVPALDPSHPPPTRSLRESAEPITLDPLEVTAPAPTPQKPQPGLELGMLRVTFNVHRRTLQSPNLLEAKIYNLSPGTMSKITQFTRVQLSAGYQFANFGQIFDGTVVQYRRGRENPTDTYLEIIAGDGDAANSATSFRRFEPGTKEKDAIEKLAQDTKYPIAYMSKNIGTQTLQRPWVTAGATQQYLREMAQKYKANYWVDNGKLYIVEHKGYLSDEAVVLSPQTGLVGIPELTPQGIQVRCLLNPKLRLAGRVKLDKTLISGIAYYPGTGPGGGFGEERSSVAPLPSGALVPQRTATTPALPGTSPTGTYKILFMEISGDTRGQPWYSDLICMAVDGVTPATVFERSVAQAPSATPS